MIRLTLTALLVALCCHSTIVRSTAEGDELERFKRWKHFVVTPALPGDAWGTGGIAVADFNRDGQLDFAVSRRQPQTAYWFQRLRDDQWQRHEVGQHERLQRTLGAAAVDLDRDGWTDVAFWGVWFRNPGRAAATTPWHAHDYAGGGHDVIAADLNGDGNDDLVTYDGHVLSWFDPSDSMRQRIVLKDRDEHGGVAPQGAGDLNGDGRVDLVVPGMWLENPSDPNASWKQHPWPHQGVDKASYGTSMRTWIADLDQDGHAEIIYSDCDTGYSHVYVVINGGHGNSWTRKQLPDPPGDKHTGSFHSLAVADFDQDGRWEIFAGEQEDPDTYMEANGLLPMKPPGLKERGVIWALPDGGDLSQYRPVVIHTDNPGWHDAVVHDFDGDGDGDIITKVWNADGGSYHVDFWRNDIGS